MADRDDEAWLEALRGKAAAGTDAATRREADDLRKALRALHAERSVSAAPDDAQSLQRLLFRLRREGLLTSGAAAPRAAPARPAAWWRRAPLALAAALALGVALTVMMPAGWWSGEEDVMRSGAVQTIEVDDVAATVQRLDAALRAAGAALTVVEVGGGAREVAATVPQERIDATRSALEPFGLKLGRDGVLRIEVRPRSATAR